MYLNNLDQTKDVILLIGLKQSGKSLLLSKLKGQEYIEYRPTNFMDIQEVSIKN